MSHPAFHPRRGGDKDDVNLKQSREAAVLGAMSHAVAWIRDAAPDGGYVVHRPRDTDALGKALDRAFEPTRAQPSDLLRLIEQLDRTR
jgi:hypothetical protein